MSAGREQWHYLVMAHAYPADLAAAALEQLGGESALARLVCPESAGALAMNESLFRSLLSVAYQASLLREEERPVTFRLLIGGPEALAAARESSSLSAFPFAQARPFDEHELRRLAPAAKFQRALIGVRPLGSKLAIWGVIHSGPAWLRSIQGGRRVPEPAPPLVTVVASGPGRLVVARGERTVAKLWGGRLTGATEDVFASRWLPSIFSSVRQEILELHEEARAREGNDWARIDPDLLRLLGQHFIRRIVATVRLARHGGTLLIVPPACADGILGAGRYVALKYPIADVTARRRFRTIVLQIMRALAERERPRTGPVGWSEYTTSTDEVITTLDEALFEHAHFAAGLADVDGAVVLTQRFELLGFGGEITGDLPNVPTVARALDLESHEREIESADGVGTRHRSVYRLCNSFHDSLAVVVSQDGNVRFVRWHDGAVTYWDQLATGGVEI